VFTFLMTSYDALWFDQLYDMLAISKILGRNKSCQILNPSEFPALFWTYH